MTDEHGVMGVKIWRGTGEVETIGIFRDTDATDNFVICDRFSFKKEKAMIKEIKNAT